MKFVYVSGRRCLDFAGTMKYRNSAREELLTDPRLLSDWAVQAGAAGRRNRYHRRRSRGGNRTAQGRLPAVIARLETPASSRRRGPAQRVGVTTPAHPAIAANRSYPPRGHRIATAREPGRGSARPDCRVRHRERQRLRPPELHASLPRLPRERRTGIGAGWAPAATKSRSKPFAPASAPPPLRLSPPGTNHVQQRLSATD